MLDQAPARVAPIILPRLEVVQATTSVELDAVMMLRRLVFDCEQGMVDGSVLDHDDGRSIQALALYRRSARLEPVGTGRLTLNAGERGEALISWVATRAGARHQGVGRAVMAYLIERADQAGAPLVALAAQTHAERFYRKLGFIGTGRTYTIRDVPHRWMIRRSHPRLENHAPELEGSRD